jgi:hypothetical protein
MASLSPHSMIVARTILPQAAILPILSWHGRVPYRHRFRAPA